MALKDIVKVNRKTFIDPRSWLGYDNVKEQTRTLWTTVKELFVTPTPKRQESFEQAVQRFNLTDEDLAEAQKNFLFFAGFFLVLAVFSLFVGFYLIVFHRTFAGLILAFATTALFGAQAFKYHFWSFQIKHRKLGCTFQEYRGKGDNT